MVVNSLRNEALAVLGCKKFNPNDVVVITVSGRGDKDMETYVKFFNAPNHETRK